MTLEDLQYIFQPQIDEGTTLLYFMVRDGDTTTVMRHNHNDIESLVPMLDNFVYQGTDARIPRFAK